MKHYRLPYIIIACAASMVCSCTKYLDIKPYGETIPKTAEEFSALLHYHLNSIDHGEQTILGDIASACYLECYADNLEASLTPYPAGNYFPLYIGDQLNRKQTLYANTYSVIRDCNIIIGYLEERESRTAKDVLGTAHAIRGICYYNLLRDFCEPCTGNLDGYGVPVVTEFDMEAKPLRSTMAKTIEQAESDMLSAISYGISDEVYRFNSDVMKGYLARLYFWSGNYTKASGYAREILDAYPLISGTSYTEMLGSEVTRKGNIIIKSCTVLDTGEMTSYGGTKSYVSNRPVSRSLAELFAEGERDIRYRLSFDRKRKFTKNAFACLRSAEMQLILAESLYHTGEYTGALSAVNELRRLRITDCVDYTMETLPPVDTDGLIKEDAKGNPLTPLLYAIMCERRKELFMEGDRWYELKRNGRPEFWAAKQGRKYTTMRFMYTFPLPINDIELVEGLVQNPGYTQTR